MSRISPADPADRSDVTTISVVIPAFNEETAIRECLGRWLAQSRPVDEIIVVDNGSTDTTAAIVDDVARAHPVVRRVEERQKGTASARRRGFDEAESSLIVKSDADSLVSSDWADRVVGFFDSDEGAEYSALSTGLVLWDAPDVERQRARLGRQSSAAGGGQESESLNGPNYTLRSGAWDDVCGSLNDFPGIWEDLDLSLALQEAGHRMYLDPRIIVETSGRRFLNSPWDNRNYVLAGWRTSRARGRGGFAVYCDPPFRLAMFTLLWLRYRPWDPATRSRRLRRFLEPLDKRVDP